VFRWIFEGEFIRLEGRDVLAVHTLEWASFVLEERRLFVLVVLVNLNMLVLVITLASTIGDLHSLMLEKILLALRNVIIVLLLPINDRGVLFGMGIRNVCSSRNFLFLSIR
jgi:hypothetical protein